MCHSIISLGLNILLNIRECLPERSGAQEHDVPLVLLTGSEPLVSAVEIVQDPQDSVALVKLQVVIVVSLWGW